MTTITLTPDTATGSVTLDILKSGDVTSITRTNVNGTENVRVAGGQLPSPAVQTLVRTNLFPNPSFETGTTGWVADKYNTGQTLASVTVTGTPAGAGSKVLRATSTTSTATYIGPMYPITLTGGKTYTISFYYRSSAPVHIAETFLETTTGTFISRTKRGETNEGDWKRVYGTYVVPGTGSQSLIAFLNTFRSGTTYQVGEYSEFDAALIEEGDTISPYFDGATPDVSGFNYGWTGTAHASTSTLSTVGGRLILTDYEAAQGTNAYNVYKADGTFVTASTELVIDKPWLMVPIAPNYSEQVDTITDYSAGREMRSTVHHIIGRSDPLVVMGKLGSRSGTLEFLAWDLQDVARLARVFDRGEPVLLKQVVPGMDMYLAASSVEVSPHAVEGDLTRFKFTVNYQEVSRPYGDLAGALGWTFDQLAAEYTSFDAVAAAFATFDDLTLMDKK